MNYDLRIIAFFVHKISAVDADKLPLYFKAKRNLVL